MPFQRFVQTGRVAKASNGPLKNRLVSIVDVIDQNRVLVDGPLTGVPRQQYRLDDLHLTKFRLKFPYHAPTRVVRKAWKETKLTQKWKQTEWSQKGKSVRKRTHLNDFDRFKLRQAKRSRNKILESSYKQLKRRANRDGTLYGPKSIVPFKFDEKKKRQPKTKTAKNVKSVAK